MNGLEWALECMVALDRLRPRNGDPWLTITTEQPLGSTTTPSTGPIAHLPPFHLTAMQLLKRNSQEATRRVRWFSITNVPSNRTYNGR